MKKIILFCSMLFVGAGMHAQEIENPDIVLLSMPTLNVSASEASGCQTYYFDETCKGVTLSMGGRAIAEKVRQNFSTGLNFKNNSVYTINLPEGVQMYGVQFAGFSNGDNWCYLNAYGPIESEWEWTEPIGSGVKDNETIISKAVYPLDPCVSALGTPVYNNAGYTFASIGFGDLPYEGTFAFQFSGNNQEQALIRVFTTKAAWDTYSEQCKAVDYGSESTGIDIVETDKGAHGGNGVKYNMAGQRVSSPEGLYIMNGKKYIAK